MKYLIILIFLIPFNLFAECDFYGTNNQAGQEWIDAYATATMDLEDLSFYITASTTVNVNYIGTHTTSLWQAFNIRSFPYNSLQSWGKNKREYGPDYNGSPTLRMKIYCPATDSGTCYRDPYGGKAGICQEDHFGYLLIGSSTLFYLKEDAEYSIKEVK